MTLVNFVRPIAMLAVAAATIAATPYSAVTPGIAFDIAVTMSVQPELPNGAGNATLVGRGRATADGAMRMDMTSTAATPGPIASGDYFVTVDGKAMLVRPATKTYIDMVDQATGLLNSLPPEMAAQITVSDITGTTEKIDGAETVEGRPSDHYRSTVSYTVGMMGQSVPTTVVTDYWLVKLPVKFINPFATQTSQPSSSASASPLAALIKKQLEIMPPMNDRIAIKTTSTTSLSMMGQSLVTTLSTAMTNIKEGDVDASDMALPAGYTKAAK